MDAIYHYSPRASKVEAEPNYRFKKFFGLMSWLVFYPLSWYLEHFRGIYLMHASGIDISGHGIVIGGVGGVGKTTTGVSLLAHEGTRLVSENLIFHDASHIYSCYEPIRLDDQSVELLGSRRHILAPARNPGRRQPQERLPRASPGGRGRGRGERGVHSALHATGVRAAAGCRTRHRIAARFQHPDARGERLPVVRRDAQRRLADTAFARTPRRDAARLARSHHGLRTRHRSQPRCRTRRARHPRARRGGRPARDSRTPRGLCSDERAHRIQQSRRRPPPRRPSRHTMAVASRCTCSSTRN